LIFEKSFIPSSTKFRSPNSEAFVGDWRCCVDASKHLSTEDEIPDAESKIKILNLDQNVIDMQKRLILVVG